MNTFVGHPWFFRDRQTGEKMVVRSSDVYLPEGHPPGSVLRRRLINITIPGEFSLVQVDGLMQNCSPVHQELLQSCIKPWMPTHRLLEIAAANPGKCG